MIVVPAAQNTELVGKYVAEQCGSEFAPGMYQALAILDDDGRFCAGVVISEWRGHDCQISCATETSAAWRPNVLTGVFKYIFEQLGCVRCTSITKKSNKRCRDFLTGLGFQLEGRMRMGYDGVKDALIYGFLASECRYIQGVSDGDATASEAIGPAGNGLAEGPVPGEGTDANPEETVPSIAATEAYKDARSNGATKQHDEFWTF